MISNRVQCVPLERVVITCHFGKKTTPKRRIFEDRKGKDNEGRWYLKKCLGGASLKKIYAPNQE